MGILAGKQILVTGVTKHTSIAYEVARLAQDQGATVVVSNFGRALRLTNRVVQRLDPAPAVIELDVTDDDQLSGLPETLRQHLDRVDGIVHSIAYANPQTALGGRFLQTPWSDVASAVQVSAYSMVSLVNACRALMTNNASVVGLTFDATLAWPVYDWMGVGKAALESVNRYLARYLGEAGIRSNLVAAGPLDTLAKQAIPGADEFNAIWSERAPLGWDASDLAPTAKAVVALLSDWFPATTGEIVHVDGGLHAMGA